MKVTYIWHDCFVVESESGTLIFDFWKDPLYKPGERPMFFDRIDTDKPLYVFVSHHHKDHYTKRIFEWREYAVKIHYILSNDVRKFARHILNPDTVYAGPRPADSEVTVLHSGESFDDGVIHVDAFASTDIGNSYVVKIDGMTVFHAGDLNAWIWKDESTEQEIRKAMGDFTAIVRSVKEKYPEIDYAMFPVDSRIGRDYFTGAYHFVREVNVGHFFPMHFGLGETAEEQMKYKIDAARLDLYANKERGEYICLQSPYSSFQDSRLSEHPGEKQG